MKSIVCLVKSLLILVLTYCCSSACLAQEARSNTEISVGIDGGFPVGSFHKQSNIGIGGSLKYGYNINPTAAVTLQSGYISFLGKNTRQGEGPVYKTFQTAQIPVKAGLRLTKGRYYIEPQAGVSFLAGGPYHNTAFTYAAGIGKKLLDHFDVCVRYEAWSNNGTSSFIGLRLAYIFRNIVIR